jgi:hypothetical protein
MPSGRFLMEDFYYAGGLPAVVRALDQRSLIHRDALTVNGKTIWENCESAPNWNSEVIRPLENPLVEHGGIAVLRGNLAPDGAVLKPSAASPHLMSHRGRSVVFENIEHYKERIDLWFVKTSRTDKRFPPRGVCLLIQDSLLLQMLLQGTARPTTETSPEFLLGIIRAVPGRRSWNLSRNSVTMVQPAESREGLSPVSLCRTDRGRTPFRSVLRQSQMRSVLMVVANIFGHQPLEMAFIQHDHVIEQISTAASYPALGDTVPPRTAKARSYRLTAQVLHS